MRAAPKKNMPVKHKFADNTPVMTIDTIKNEKDDVTVCTHWFGADGELKKGCFSQDVLEKHTSKK